MGAPKIQQDLDLNILDLDKAEKAAKLLERMAVAARKLEEVNKSVAKTRGQTGSGKGADTKGTKESTQADEASTKAKNKNTEATKKQTDAKRKSTQASKNEKGATRELTEEERNLAAVKAKEARDRQKAARAKIAAEREAARAASRARREKQRSIAESSKFKTHVASEAVALGKATDAQQKLYRVEKKRRREREVASRQSRTLFPSQSSTFALGGGRAGIERERRETERLNKAKLRQKQIDLENANARGYTRQQREMQTVAIKKETIATRAGSAAKRALAGANRMVSGSLSRLGKMFGSTSSRARFFNRRIDRTNKELKETNFRARLAAGGIAVMGGTFRTMVSGAAFHAKTSGLLSIFAAIALVRGAIEGMIKPMAQFDKAMAGVRKTTELSARETDELGKAFIGLSSRLGVSRMEIAKIGEVAGQMGIRGFNKIYRFTETVAIMTQTLDLSAEKAAAAMGQISQSFDIPIEKANQMGSVINELSNNTTASAAKLIQALGKVGPVAKTLGLTLAETSAAAATLIHTGFVAPRAGTNLRNLFVLIQTRAADIARIMGKTTGEFTKGLEENTLPTLKEFLALIKDMTSSAQAQQLKALFGQENFAAIQALAVMPLTLAHNIRLANEAWTEGTSLIEEYGRMIDNVATRGERMGIRFKNFFVTMGVNMKESIEKALSLFEKGQSLPLSVLEAQRESFVKEVAALEKSRAEGIIPDDDETFDRRKQLLLWIKQWNEEIHEAKLDARDPINVKIEIGTLEEEVSTFTKELEDLEENTLQRGQDWWIESWLATSKNLKEATKDLQHYKEVLADINREAAKRTGRESEEEDARALAWVPSTDLQQRMDIADRNAASAGTVLQENNELKTLERQALKIQAHIHQMEKDVLHELKNIDAAAPFLKQQVANYNKMQEALGVIHQRMADIRVEHKKNTAAWKEFMSNTAEIGKVFEEGLADISFSDLFGEDAEMAEEYFNSLLEKIDYGKVASLLDDKLAKATKDVKDSSIVVDVEFEAQKESIEDLKKRAKEIDVLSQAVDEGKVDAEMLIEPFKQFDDGMKAVFGEDWKDGLVSMTRADALGATIDKVDEVRTEADKAAEEEKRKEIERLKEFENGLRAIMDQAKSINRLINDFADMADVFGLMSENTNAFVNSLTKAIDRAFALSTELKRMRETKSGLNFSTVSAGLGLVAGVGGIASSFLQISKQIGERARRQREEAKEQRDEAIRVSIENRMKLEESLEKLLGDDQVAPDTRGDLITSLSEAFEHLKETGKAYADATDPKSPYFEADPKARDEARQRYDFAKVAVNDLLNQLGLPGVLMNASLQQWVDAIGEHLETLVNDHGKFSKSLDGLLASIDFLNRFTDTTATESLQRFVDGLEEMDKAPQWLRDALSGIDLSTDEGRQILDDLIAQWASDIEGGAGAEFFGDLTPNEFEDILGFLSGLTNAQDIEGVNGVSELVASLTRLSQFIDLDVTDAFGRFMDGLTEMEDVPEWVKSALSGIDLSTPEGQQALQDLLGTWAEAMFAGTLDIGDLAEGDFESIMGFLSGLADGSFGETDSAINTLSVSRSITDVQANAVVLLLEQLVFWNKTTAQRLGATGDFVPTSPVGGTGKTGPIIDPNAPGYIGIVPEDPGDINPGVKVGDVHVNVQANPDDVWFADAVGQAVATKIRRNGVRRI